MISLVTKGGGVVRTKHLQARMNLAKEAAQEKRIKISYVHTTRMTADGFTKVLEGKYFNFFMKSLLLSAPE